MIEKTETYCDFCDEIAGRPAGDALARLLNRQPYSRSIVAEMGEASALPSIGALAIGHLLVCPRSHERSIAAAPSEVQADVEALHRRLRGALEGRLGRYVFAFEHGSSEGGPRVACSIEHAHLHLLPWSVDPSQLFLSRIPRWEEWTAGRVGGREYLRIWVDGRWLVTYPEGDGFASQFARRLLFESVGRSDWDWKRYPQQRVVADTLAVLTDKPVAA